MKALKMCALILLSLILFLLLNIFGLAFSVHQVALDPGVVNKIIKEVDFAEIARLILDEQQGKTYTSPVMQDNIIDTITNFQPVLKEKLKIAVDDSYDYLLGGKRTPNLRVILGDSFINTDFIKKLLAEINLTNLLEQTLREESCASSNSEQALQEVLVNTFKKIEPEFKQQVVAACGPVFSYILGDTEAIDVRTTIRNTFLSYSFVAMVIENVDIKTMASYLLEDQIGPLPEGITLTSDQFDKIVTLLEPVIKTNLKSAIDPVADYFVGKATGFKVAVSFQSVIPSFKPIITEAFIANLPSDLHSATQTQIDQAADSYFNDFQDTLPTSFTFDETVFGTDINNTLENAFTEIEDGLSQARDEIENATTEFEDQLIEVRVYIGYFRIGFFVLIGLMLIIEGGIILIQRSVKGACRVLGITFLIYGALWLAGILVIRHLVPGFIQQTTTDIPHAIANLMPMLIRQLTSPLFMVSLVCLIGGIVLILVSLIYPKVQIKEAETNIVESETQQH